MKNPNSSHILSITERLNQYDLAGSCPEWAICLSDSAVSPSQRYPYFKVCGLKAAFAMAIYITSILHYSSAYAQTPAMTAPSISPVIEAPKIGEVDQKAPPTTASASTTPAENSESSTDNAVVNDCRTGEAKTSAGRLLFTLVYKNHKQIYGHDLGSKKVFPIITGPGDNYAASISPDGLRFVFISTRTGSPQVFVASWNGQDIQQLTTSSLKKSYPSWHEDGNSVYFSGELGASDNREATTGNIYSVKNTGGPEIQITRLDDRNIAPAAQPEGRLIAYSTNRFWPGWDICLFHLSQKTESCILAGSRSFIKPRISRDGKLLTFVQTQSTDSQIGVLSITNRAEGTEYFSTAEHETDPSWGSGDNEIYASSGPSAEGIHKIILRNLKTKESETIIACSYSLKEPTWSAITQAELNEEKIIGQFKLIKAIVPSVGTPHGYTPPYIKARGPSSQLQ